MTSAFTIEEGFVATIASLDVTSVIPILEAQSRMGLRLTLTCLHLPNWENPKLIGDATCVLSLVMLISEIYCILGIIFCGI